MLTVDDLITSQPTNEALDAGQDATFTAASAYATDGVLWYVSSGGGFTPLSNGSVYSGVTTKSLTIHQPASDLNGDEYEAIFTPLSSTPSASQTLTTSTAFLSVDSVTTQPSNQNVGMPVIPPSVPTVTFVTMMSSGTEADRTDYLQVDLSQPCAAPVTVSYKVTGGNAVEGTATTDDFTLPSDSGQSNSLTFSPGTVTAVIPINITNHQQTDLADPNEPDRTVSITLSTPAGSGALLGPLRTNTFTIHSVLATIGDVAATVSDGVLVVYQTQATYVGSLPESGGGVLIPGTYRMTTAGVGYFTAPGVVINTSDGKGADITTSINANGQVTAINILSGGSGYSSSDTLTINPNDDNHAILLKQIQDPATSSPSIEVFDGPNQVLGSPFDVSGLTGINATAFSGNDVVDLRGNGSPVSLPAWVYAGSGNDTLYSGSGPDLLFAGSGTTTLHGGSGQNILYGGTGVGAIYGGTGLDYWASGSNVQTVVKNLGPQDVSLDSMDYATRSLFDLAHLYTDAWGFVVDRADNGTPSGTGDATWRTGLAITATAFDLATASPGQQVADNAALATWLGALLNDGWDANANPIRHPYDPEAGGMPVVQSLTQDGLTTLVPGLYYIYTAPQSSEQVKDLAKAIAERYILYLTADNWLLTDDVEASVKLDPSQSASSYSPTPGTLFTLQNVASEMGIATGNWIGPAVIFGYQCVHRVFSPKPVAAQIDHSPRWY